MQSTFNQEIQSESQKISQQLAAVYNEIMKKTEHAQCRFPVETEEAAVSRDNLLAYLALREFDLHEVQHMLAEEGLSSLGRLEGNVVTHIEKVLGHLGVREKSDRKVRRPNSYEANQISVERNIRVLGKASHERLTNIMVTLDIAMLKTPEIFQELLLNGMDLVRINCAHDTKGEWKQLIDAVRQAEEELRQKDLYGNQECKIYMDLGGPKIRIGRFEQEMRPLKITVKKDMYGNRKGEEEGFIDLLATNTEKDENEKDKSSFVIAVGGSADFQSLRKGDSLSFIDTRGKHRLFKIISVMSPTKIKVVAESTSYLDDGTEIMGPNQEIFQVRDLRKHPVQISVQKGDMLNIYRDPAKLGHPASDGRPAGVAAMIPEALSNVQLGDKVFIDDGKIGGIVVDINEEGIGLEIVFPVYLTAKIKEEKGLNFPNTILDLPALTPQDIEDLEFVAQYADTVGLSFVHSPQDLVDLKQALIELGRPDLAVVAKIETSEAIQNLARIFLTGLNFNSFGIMIARGDLAVEVGFENLSIVQEDILCMCDAAHIPVIWATQVLENLAKKGVPARAEITDAAMGVRAECVMLNKGTHITDAVRVLSKLLTTEAQHHVKKRQVFTDFTKQKGLFE